MRIRTQPNFYRPENCRTNRTTLLHITLQSLLYFVTYIHLSHGSIQHLSTGHCFRKARNDWLHASFGHLPCHWSNHSRHFLMKTYQNTIRVETSKVLAEKINGRAALIGVIALLGAYSSTGQIIPGYL